MANDTDSASYWRHAKCKDMMAEKRGYTTILRKMFPNVLWCCNEDLQGKVRKRADFDSIESSSDILGLLNAIEQEGYRVKSAEYAPIVYHQAQVRFYRLSQ